MYGGKQVAEGDTVFVFASDNERGQGLIARGVVTSAVAIAKKAGITRQPRVSIAVRRTALVKRRWGGANSGALPTGMTASRNPSSISSSIVRHKIAGISEETAAFLDGFF